MHDDTPIAYIQRTRDYYAALGYATPYRWAQHDDVPFHRLAKPLRDCRIALITTAALVKNPGEGVPDQRTLSYDASLKFFTPTSASTATDPVLAINHVAIDFKHTTAEDPATFFPLAALRRAGKAGRIGALTPHFHFLPTNRSQRVTRDDYAPDLLSRCRADDADAAILVPNCPVCHQSAALVARHLEANGIATVIMGAAKDIVDEAGVPRFLFSDFPLGNAAGKPHDVASQDLTLSLALDLLEQATAPRTTLRSPLRWSADDSWKRDYGSVAHLTAAEIATLRAEFDRGKAIAGEIKGAQGERRS